MFGKKKKGDFFLEIDESQEKTTSAPAVEETKAEAAPEAAPAKTEAVKPAPQKASKTKTSIKDKKQAPTAPVAPPKPAPVAAKVVAPTEVNFATNYILPVFTSGPRRRPGPSLNSFLSMASEIKVPTSAR